MVSKVYTVYDSKVEAYMQPFLMQTKGQAIRAFSDSVNDESTQFFKHPEDFTLFEIGEYDDASGVYKMHDARISLGVAIEFRKQMALPGVEVAPIPRPVRESVK